MRAFFYLIGCVMFAALLLTCPQQVMQGTIAGGTLCIDVLLPSLYPFMILSSFLAHSGAGTLLARPFLPLTRLLTLPDATAPVLLTSMIGGYPTGAQTIASYVKQGQLDQNEAKQLMCCAVNAGPAFVVVAVGERMFQSSALGWRLLVAQIASSLLLCLLFCRGNKRKTEGMSNQGLPFSTSLVESVAQATRGMISIASYVLLVSILLEFISLMHIPMAVKAAMTGVLEVTTGCVAAASLGGKTGALLAAFFLSFGGLSVGFQVISLLFSVDIHPHHYFAMRLLSGLISALLIAPFLPQLPIPVASAAAVIASSPFLAAANSPNRLLGALCLIGMVVQLFSKIDRCTARLAQ